MERKEIIQGCGKEWCEEEVDCTCGEEFPDDDGKPFCILCPDCRKELEALESKGVKDEK